MIYDKIDNMSLYKGLSEDIYLGLQFLNDLTHDIENGVHELSPRVKAIVSEYDTMPINPNGYETHKRFIDIQYLVKGTEKINVLPIEQLCLKTKYNKETDVSFYSSEEKPIELVLKDCYFAIFYPQDGHMPQLCNVFSDNVKKVVIKIEI